MPQITLTISDEHTTRIRNALDAHDLPGTPAEHLAMVKAELRRHLIRWVYRLEVDAATNTATAGIDRIDAS